jgi:hypothetical protein
MLLVLFFAGLALPPLVGGIDAIRWGWRAFRSQRLPPPGAWVLRDTRVIRGPWARRMGAVALTLGVLLVLLASALPVLAHHAAGLIARAPVCRHLAR